jgi:hypothetical protein
MYAITYRFTSTRAHATYRGTTPVVTAISDTQSRVHMEVDYLKPAWRAIGTGSACLASGCSYGGFSVRKTTRQDKKNGASALQQVIVLQGGGTELHRARSTTARPRRSKRGSERIPRLEPMLRTVLHWPMSLRQTTSRTNIRSWLSSAMQERCHPKSSIRRRRSCSIRWPRSTTRRGRRAGSS